MRGPAPADDSGRLQTATTMLDTFEPHKRDVCFHAVIGNASLAAVSPTVPASAVAAMCTAGVHEGQRKERRRAQVSHGLQLQSLWRTATAAVS